MHDVLFPIIKSSIVNGLICLRGSTFLPSFSTFCFLFLFKFYSSSHALSLSLCDDSCAEAESGFQLGSIRLTGTIRLLRSQETKLPIYIFEEQTLHRPRTPSSQKSSSKVNASNRCHAPQQILKGNIEAMDVTTDTANAFLRVASG